MNKEYSHYLYRICLYYYTIYLSTVIILTYTEHFTLKGQVSRNSLVNIYCLLNDKEKALKKFGLRTLCRKKSFGHRAAHHFLEYNVLS